MNPLPESLRKVLENLPKQPAKPKEPATQIYTRTETTTILRDGTVYRTKADGTVVFLKDIKPIS